MGVIYYKNKQYASGGSTSSSSDYVELTWAEYEALSTEEKNSDITYFITDVDTEGVITGYTGGIGIQISKDKVISVKADTELDIDSDNAIANSAVTTALATLPFKWTLIGTSTPETSETSNNLFSQTMSSGLPFLVFHAGGVFCFGNGANKGVLFGNTVCSVADVTYSDEGLLAVSVGQGKAYIYQMVNITE